jgi:hypothetical protein
MTDGPGYPNDWIGLYPAGSSAYLDWKYLNSSQTTPANGATDATVTFAMPAAPGAYVLKFHSRNSVLATSSIITVAGVGFVISETATVPLGLVTATVANGPGNVDDSVELYADGGTSPVDWQYLNGTQNAPTAGLTAATVVFTMPITPGMYSLRLSSTTGTLATSPPITVAVPSESTTLTASPTSVMTLGTVTATLANGPGHPNDWIALYATGSTTLLDWKYLNDSQTSPATSVTDATVHFTMPATAGPYRLTFQDGDTLLAMSDVITVIGPTLHVGTASAAPSSSVTVTVANGPGNVNDWIALSPAGGTTYLDWKYLNNSQTAPSSPMTGGTVTLTMPAMPGAYVVQFRRVNTVLASEPIAVESCTFGPQPASVALGASGGSGQVIVTTPSGCSWTASSNASWVTVDSSMRVGPGAATYTVAANATQASRLATLTVAGQAVTISEEASPAPACSYSVSPTTVDIGPSGGTGQLTVTTTADCGWTATSAATWTTVTTTVAEGS